MIDNRNEMFQIPPTKVVYAYSAWQPVFDEINGVEFTMAYQHNKI